GAINNPPGRRVLATLEKTQKSEDFSPFDKLRVNHHSPGFSRVAGEVVCPGCAPLLQTGLIERRYICPIRAELDTIDNWRKKSSPVSDEE
ncbi:MAG: hypothetical protein AAB538_03270, partial [Patescibacteria group bacterium]